MARSFPRFLLTNATKSKSTGTFIIHTLEPAFITQPVFNDARQIVDTQVLKVFTKEPGVLGEAREIAANEIPKWWMYSGIHESSDPRDIVIAKLSGFSFLKDQNEHFTIEEAEEMINVLYPSKAKTIYTGVNSYGIKHDFERLSQLFIPGYGRKYCSNDTVKQAFANCGFKHTTDGPNESYNISEKECNRIRKIAFFVVNKRPLTI